MMAQESMLCFLPCPVFPDAGERERLAVFRSDEVRLFGALELTPLIVCVGRDEAPPVTEGISESRLLGDGLRASVDGAISVLGASFRLSC